MSQDKRSFFSTIPGLVTGLAGLLTGIVGLVTVLIQLGVLGDDDSSQKVGTTATTTGAGAGGTPTTEAGRFTVSPTLLKLQAAERDKTLTIRNPTATATITVLAPQFSGTDASVFKSDAGCTNVRLEPGRSCTLKVLFSPSGPLKTYKANVVLKADGVNAATEVPVEATTIL